MFKKEKFLKNGSLFLAVMSVFFICNIAMAKTVISCGTPVEVTLYAGQTINVGTIAVYNDSANLYIKYTTTDGWTLDETHLVIATSLGDIPQSQKGVPIVGHFPYKTIHSLSVTEYVYVINLEEVGYTVDTELYIAAHADVSLLDDNGNIVQEEGAWGSGINFLGKNWATYFTYIVQSCPQAFLSTPNFSPDTIFSNTDTDIIAAITVEGDFEGDELTLWFCNENGSPLDIAAVLYDNGNLAIGDDIKGDGIFHGVFNINPNSNADLFCRVSDITNQQWSNISRLAVVPYVSDERMDEIANQTTTAKTIYDNVIAAGGSPLEAQAALQDFIASLPGIAEQGVENNGYGSWWITTDGVPCLHNPNVGSSSVRTGSSDQFRQPNPPLPSAVADGKTLLPVNYPTKPLTDENDIVQIQALTLASSNKAPKSKNALLLDVFAFNSENPHIEQVLNDLCYKVERVNLNVTLNHFKSLKNYGVVTVVGHGTTYYKGWMTLWFEEWGSDKGSAQSVINTQIAQTNSESMKKDISAGRLAVTPNKTIAILPAFISFYNKDFPDSLIYMGTCRGAWNDKLAKAFFTAGAATYFGYSDYVGDSWAKARGENLFDHLKGGNTAGTSPEIGMKETDKDPAEFKMFGETDLIIVQPDIVNGYFEEGTLAGWSPVGDARIITKLGTLGVHEGQYMAIVSTGLGSVNESSSILSQKVSPTNDKHTLKFSYNVVSEEPMEWVGTVFDDKFEIIINGSVTLLESVNTSTWSELGGDYFYGGDSTTYHTGWKEYTIDLSSHIGNCVEVQFKTYDQGDSIYDTAALLDSIRLE